MPMGKDQKTGKNRQNYSWNVATNWVALSILGPKDFAQSCRVDEPLLKISNHSIKTHRTKNPPTLTLYHIIMSLYLCHKTRTTDQTVQLESSQKLSQFFPFSASLSPYYCNTLFIEFLSISFATAKSTSSSSDLEVDFARRYLSVLRTLQGYLFLNMINESVIRALTWNKVLYVHISCHQTLVKSYYFINYAIFHKDI